MLRKTLKVAEQMLKTEAATATAEYRDHVRMVRSKAPPLRIELVDTMDKAWLDGAPVRPVVEFLSRAGFQLAGVVAVKGNPKAVIAGFAATQQGVFASIPKGSDRVFLSFLSHFTDGSAFECSSMPVPFEPACPEWLLRHRRTGASASELWSYFLAQRPLNPMLPATAESFAASASEDFFRYQAWSAERGGATRAEHAARYKAVGRLAEGEEGERFLDMARSDEIERSLCNWWRLQPNAPYPLEEVMGSLIIVHDEMAPDLLANAYWCGTDDFKAQASDFAGGAPREAFGRVVASRGSLLRKVFEKHTSLLADFYLPRGG
jgi:hypothetical protein